MSSLKKMTSSTHHRWMSAFVAVISLSSSYFCPAGAIRALSYNERMIAISRLLPQQQDRNSRDREAIADFTRFLQTLSQSAIQEAILESVRTLSGSEYGDRNFGAVEALQVNETDVCLNHTAAVIIGLVMREGWALQSGC